MSRIIRIGVPFVVSVALLTGLASAAHGQAPAADPSQPPSEEEPVPRAEPPDQAPDTGADPAAQTETADPAETSTPAKPPTLTNPKIYADSFRALFVLFIVAVVLESGLAVVFNWRPFVEHFDARGVKTLVSLAFAYWFVEYFNWDIATRLVNIYLDPKDVFNVNWAGKFITALVLAGGSSGVNKLMIGLGFRSVKTQQSVAPKPKPQEAWLSVRLTRAQAQGPVTVLVGPAGGPAEVAGTIAGKSRENRLARYFVRDFGRFPTAGGYSVAPGPDYTVQLEGVDASGAKITSAAWGPHSFAKGAIVDLDLSL